MIVLKNWSQSKPASDLPEIFSGGGAGDAGGERLNAARAQGILAERIGSIMECESFLSPIHHRTFTQIHVDTILFRSSRR